MTRTALLAAALLLAAPAGAEPPPYEDYVLHCAGCHGLDGAGTPGVIPSLHALGGVLATPAGRRYLARVPGAAQAPVDDARLARLLNWVLAEFSHAPPAPPYTAAEVGPLRSAPLRDPIAARAALDADPR